MKKLVKGDRCTVSLGLRFGNPSAEQLVLLKGVYVGESDAGHIIEGTNSKGEPWLFGPYPFDEIR